MIPYLRVYLIENVQVPPHVSSRWFLVLLGGCAGRGVPVCVESIELRISTEPIELGIGSDGPQLKPQSDFR